MLVGEKLVRLRDAAIRLVAPTALFMAAVPTQSFADGARDWVNVPVGMNFLYVYYTHSNADTSIDSVLPVNGVGVDASVPILRYARSFDLFGQVGGIQLVAPYGFVDARLDGTAVETSTKGFGDIQTILAANLYGAPSLSVEEFATWSPEQYLTASLAITAPTGSYDPDRLLNVGKNRWGFKPQLSWGQPYEWGGLLSVNGNVQIFTDNDEYFRNRSLEQDALYMVEAHYSQNLNKALWLSFDAFYSYGGETSIDGLDQDNVQSTLRLGVSANLNLTPVNAISIAYNQTVAKRDTTPDAGVFSVNLSHAW